MIRVIENKNQAKGAFNNGEILEISQLVFLKMVVKLSHIQIFFTGLMPGQLINQVQLDYIHIKDLKYVVLF